MINLFEKVFCRNNFLTKTLYSYGCASLDSKLWSCYPIKKDKTYTVLKPKLQTNFYSLHKFSRYLYISCSELISILQYFIVLSSKSVSHYIEFLIINKVGTTNSWCTISILAYYYHLSVLVSHIVLPRACHKRGGRGRYDLMSSYLKRFDSIKMSNLASRAHKLVIHCERFQNCLIMTK